MNSPLQQLRSLGSMLLTLCVNVSCAMASPAPGPAEPPAASPVAASPVAASPVAVAPALAPLPAAPRAVDPLDWPMWRGPEMNGTSRELDLPDRWSPEGENLLWTKPELAGRSTPIVMHGKLYTLTRVEPGTRREAERVVCADAATGQILWENRFNVFLSDVPDTRVAWSSVVGDPTTGRVYALGVCGYFQCLDGDTGKTLWSHSLSEEFGLLSTYGGRTNCPILFEDMVIISAVMTGWGDLARPVHRFIAFDKETGQPVWLAGTRPLPDDTTYSTPVTAVLGGQAAMVFGSGDGGVYAFQPRTGGRIWNYQFSMRGINTTPLIDQGTVYLAQSEENLGDTTMGAVAAVNGSGKGDIEKTNVLWRKKEIMVGKASPVLIGERLYFFDDGAGLFVIDAKTGDQIFKKKFGTMQRASPLYADGKIYIADANGRSYILKPTDKGVDILHRLQIPGEVHGSAIASHGRIYITTTEQFYCIGKKDAVPKAAARPPAPAEAPLEDRKLAQLLVIPGELILAPGATQPFTVRGFNARGQRLPDVQATFAVTGDGAIDAKGIYTASQGAAHAAATITATAGGVSAQARLRIVPPLPWSFDFEAGEVPIPWVGARYRHVVRDEGGNKVMVKVTTIPKGTRSQSWFGQTNLHDYTVQADLRGAEKDGKRPDMGVIAQRYTLDLMGEHQQIQIRTWPPVLRMAKTLPFPWKTGVWYTVKLRAENQGAKAVLRGKVWLRGEPEPAAWTIEAEDESPNVTGSPGLFGNATNAEIFIDNIKVTPNAP